MSKNNKKQTRRLIPVLLIAAVIGIVLLVLLRSGPDTPVTLPAQTTQPTEESQSAPTVAVELQEFTPINLGRGLTVTDAGSYTGTYMEDGSDEFVSGIAMIVVRNDGEDDIQLTDIELSWGGELCRFRLTNLAAGARAVLLEQERMACPDGVPQSAVTENVAVFSAPMSLCQDRIKVTGMDGMVNVQNISDTDIDGDIYVYYKYAADDLYYGGITFRIRVEGGLAAGEIRQIPAGHYSPDGCAVIHVECHG